MVDSMRTLLGDSLYQWTLQFGQYMDRMWNSILVWRVLTLVLLLILIARFYRRPA